MENLLSVRYSKNSSSIEDVLTHLRSVDCTFHVPLSKRVDILEYSNKLVNKAVRQEAWHKESLIGLVAYYINHNQNSIYVTNVSVVPEYRGYGVASKLLNFLREDACNMHVYRIDLDADQSLVDFYMKNGYSIVDSSEENTCRMRCNLLNVKVAVRCLVYNHSLYLRECLNGFVMQKTNFDFVAIVHDDASTDDSANIIREFATKYPNIIKPIFETENQYSKHDGTIGKIMSEAIEATGAEYVAICEGDDYWTDPYKLQKQVDWLDAHDDYVVCFHNAFVQSSNNRGLFNSLNENHYPTTEDIITRRWFIATASLLYRNIIKIYPEWSKSIVNGDYLLELLLAKEGKFYYMDDIMSVYRVEGQGISSLLNANKVQMYDNLINLLFQMKDWYKGQYSAAFDKSITNYEKEKKLCEIEMFYYKHPFLKAFRAKTYKRAIKRWIKSKI